MNEPKTIPALEELLQDYTFLAASAPAQTADVMYALAAQVRATAGKLLSACERDMSSTNFALLCRNIGVKPRKGRAKK